MYTDINWQLPIACRAESVASSLSWDGQIYYACERCSWEVRVDHALAVNGASFDGGACAECGADALRLVRHLEHRENVCEDCGHYFESDVTSYSTPECPSCLSSRLGVLTSRIVPPFPPRFGEMLYPKDEPWGESALADGKYIIQSNMPLNTLPDFPLYFLLATRLCRRLRLYGGYDGEEQVANIKNVEANLFRDYFKRTGDIPAGLEALRLFEECVPASDDPLWRGMIEHNVAMAVYSLLAKYSEDMVSVLALRPRLKQDGVAAAERALKVFEEGPQHASEQWRMQSARIHHLLGDLLKIGDADDAELRLAVEHCDRALAGGLLTPRMAIGVRESRSVAVTKMKKPAPELLDSALEDLQAVISNDESDRAWSEKWAPLSNFFNIYRQRGETRKGLPLIEQAANLALGEIKEINDSHLLQQKGRLYANVFDDLADAYVELGRPAQALDAVETLRAATVRVYTRPEEEKSEFDREAAETAFENFFARLLRGQPRHASPGKLELEPVRPRLKKLRRKVADRATAFLTFVMRGGRVSVVAALPSGQQDDGVRGLQWEPGEDFYKILSRHLGGGTEPGVFRERRLRRVCGAAYRSLFAPLLQPLAESGCTRIGVSAPSPLSLLPFEAFGDPDGGGACVADEFQVFYLPSVTLGADLMEAEARRGGGRLLIVGYCGSDLPETAVEVAAISKAWGGRVTLLEGADCTKKNVLAELRGDYDFVHFVCHGTFDVLDPLDSALLLQLRADSDHYRVTARNLLGIRFRRAPVITLSACSSALTSFSSTNDCTGLTGSFLQAGARCVIGSRWVVRDRASSSFMTTLYGKLLEPSRSPLAAVGEVQAAMRARHGIEDWAAFSFLGMP